MADVTPCYQCTERKPYCHGSCEKYKDWKAQLDAEKSAMAKYRERYMPTPHQRRAYCIYVNSSKYKGRRYP